MSISVFITCSYGASQPPFLQITISIFPPSLSSGWVSFLCLPRGPYLIYLHGESSIAFHFLRSQYVNGRRCRGVKYNSPGPFPPTKLHGQRLSMMCCSIKGVKPVTGPAGYFAQPLSTFSLNITLTTNPRGIYLSTFHIFPITFTHAFPPYFYFLATLFQISHSYGWGVL